MHVLKLNPWHVRRSVADCRCIAVDVDVGSKLLVASRRGRTRQVDLQGACMDVVGLGTRKLPRYDARRERPRKPVTEEA